MLTTDQRNVIADDITEEVVRRVRLQIQETLGTRINQVGNQDVLAIERQVAVQLLTGRRSIAPAGPVRNGLEYGDVSRCLELVGVTKCDPR